MIRMLIVGWLAVGLLAYGNSVGTHHIEIAETQPMPPPWNDLFLSTGGTTLTITSHTHSYSVNGSTLATTSTDTPNH